MAARDGRCSSWTATGVAAAAAFVFFFRPIHDDDVWLHFAAGRWILEHGAAPSADPFSCTAPGVRWVDHEWLAQVAFECLRRLGGLPLFRAALAACAGLAFATAMRTASRLGAGAAGALVASLAALALDWHLARLRPHLLTLLLTALLVDRFVARDRPLRRRDLLGFGVLVVIWANVHAAAVVAPALLGLAALGAWAGAQRDHARRLAVLTAAAAVLLLVNPYGWQVYGYAFETQELADLIPEWKPLASLVLDPVERARRTPGSDFAFQLVAVSAVAALVVALAAWTLVAARRAARAGRGAPSDPALAIPSVAVAILPFTANRHDLFLVVPLVFVAAALASLARETPSLAPVRRAIGWIAAAVVVAQLARDTAYRVPKYREATGSVFPDVWPPHEPFAAVDFLARNGIAGNCLNRPPWGGYLLYRTFPDVRVAFDGRITTLGKDAYLDVRDFLLGQRCAEIAERYAIDFLLAPPWLFGRGTPRDAPAYVAPDLSRDWVVVYEDADFEREGSATVALRRASPLFERNLDRARRGRAGDERPPR
ncbi:MAG TPA: hypothetical protein VKE69_11725 [Planctomycetota bacterium]|nr:hypothetical protein [Planctomycetota bacterium]